MYIRVASLRILYSTCYSVARLSATLFYREATMEPKNEIQPPHVTFHPIDELENGENKRGAVLFGHVFQLAFAAVCDELIQQEKWEQCHGCAINRPSQRQHSCLMIDNEEAWFR